MMKKVYINNEQVYTFINFTQQAFLTNHDQVLDH